MKLLVIILSGLLGATALSAETFFTLKGVKKVYPVVEISGADVPKEAKTYMTDAVRTMTRELGIDTDGYSQRSLALLVSEHYTGKTPRIDVRLLIGEQVRRQDSDEKVFGITYQNVSSFALDAETVEDALEDAVDELLAKFADQYEQEQGTFRRVDEKGGDVASALGYGTDYAEAVETARAQGKNVMLVLVSNFCPWCRKFEEQVLRKEDVNALVHQKYVPVILNKEKDPFPAELDMAFTPVVYFIDPATQKSYHQSVGYNERDAFMHWLRTDTER